MLQTSLLLMKSLNKTETPFSNLSCVLDDDDEFRFNDTSIH